MHGDAGLGVEQRDSRRVPGQGSGVRVTEDLEVVVDGVANHHLPTEQLQDLQTQNCQLMYQKDLHYPGSRILPLTPSYLTICNFEKPVNLN